MSFLANQGLSTGTIKVYLSALRHKQVALGFPDPQHTSMPKLKVVTNGVTRERSKSAAATKVPARLPITPIILHQIKQLWSPKRSDPDTVMLWAVCTTCLLYTSPSPRDATLSRMPSSA